MKSENKNDDQFWYAQGSSWSLTHSDWDSERARYFETIFSLANGYFGFRGYHDEIGNTQDSVREGYLAGMFADLSPLSRRLVVHEFPWASRQMIALPEFFSTLVYLNGEAFSLNAGTVDSFSESLDIRHSVLKRVVTWTSPKGNTSQLGFTRFLSADNPHLAVQKVEVLPVNWSGMVEVYWEYSVTEPTRFRCGDQAKPNVPCNHVKLRQVGSSSNEVMAQVQTIGSKHDIVYSSKVLDGDVKCAASESGTLSQFVTTQVKSGERRTWTRCTTVTTSRDQAKDDPLTRAYHISVELSSLGYAGLLKNHQDVWEARWQQSDVEISGPSRDQMLVRFGVYSLLQVAPYHADNLSIPARCYAFNRYNGLYFWDGEIFLLPFYQFCAPDVAKNLLNFRCHTLEGAKKNAASLGAKGALFPWQGDADQGCEQAPWGLHEYLWHQNADIIYAFDQYVRSTGDIDFVFKNALHAFAETARFWVSQLKLGEDDLYHLEDTVGPDESEDRGIDNGYTIMMCQRSLEISCRWWNRAMQDSSADCQSMIAELGVGQDEIAEWQAIAGNISVPEVPGLKGVPLQDEHFLSKKAEPINEMTVAEYWQRRGEVQVIKQADIVLAMYLLEDSFSPETIRAAYEFYEPKTLHVSSLSYNTHSIVAAGIGKKGEAYDYFLRAGGLDLDNLRNATKDGLHAAALGAVWQMTVPGFAGMRVREDHLYFQPALPEQWSEMKFSLKYQDWELEIKIDHNDYSITVSGVGQCGAKIIVGKQKHILSEASTILGTFDSEAGAKNSVSSEKIN